MCMQTYLCVWEAEAAQVSRHLQAEGPHLLQALHGVIFYFLQGIVLGRIVHLLHTESRNMEGEWRVWARGQINLARKGFKLPRKICRQAPRALEETAPAPHSKLRHTQKLIHYCATKLFNEMLSMFHTDINIIYLRGRGTLEQWRFAPWKCWQQMIWIPV